MEEIIKAEREYLINVLNKKLIDSDERANNYKQLAQKYWPEEFEDNYQKEVHHIDFDHTNSVVSNLVVLSKSEHRKIHFLFDPSFCGLKAKLIKSREKQSQIMIERGSTKGVRNGMYGKRGINNPNYGSKRSEESRQRMREKKIEYWKNKKANQI